MYQKRTYRNLIRKDDLFSFNVTVKETDLFIQAAGPLKAITRELILQYRGFIESYIETYPDFIKTLTPWRITGPAPLIIRDMVAAGAKAGVGPMAAVAGAIAARVGTDLLSYTNEVIVENGGDIFFKFENTLTIGIFAGASALNLRVGIKVKSMNQPMAVCTSSGTVGHSLSFGKADAVCVLSSSCALADAAATAIGNQVKTKVDIHTAIDFGKTIKGVTGIVVIVGDQIGLWGELEVVPL